MRIQLVRFIAAFSVLLCSQFPAFGSPKKSQEIPQEMTSYEKEAISSIREITLKLIMISVGVFTIIGSFVATRSDPVTARGSIKLAFGLLATSILFGLLTYGALINDLVQGRFEPGGLLQGCAFLQWVLFALGAPFVISFLLQNITFQPRTGSPSP